MMTHSFLLIGQSNMAGRGFVGEVEPIDNNDVFVLRNGRWRKMYTPVNPDRETAGVCLAESFAYLFSRHYNADVGIIPCADGGSHLDQWLPGEILFDHAVGQAKLAQRTTTIVGVLWHQGESDSLYDRYPHYEEKCTLIFEAMRKELDLGDDVPFLMGGLGDYLVNYFRKEHAACFGFVNQAIESMAEHNDWIGFVSAAGLEDKGDNLHFSARALREFGRRYFDRFVEMSPLIPAKDQAAFDDQAGELEHL
jgi:hypothetical protein